jgi:hypothetical protein
MDHTGITANCMSCHNGTTARSKPATHFVTTLPCETCHRPAGWTLVSFVHPSPTYPNHGTRLTCISCHTSNAQAIPWKFVAYRPDCAGCHAGNFKPSPHTKYERPAKVSYTVSDLRNCTGACHIYADSSLTTITTRRSGRHRPTAGAFE